MSDLWRANGKELHFSSDPHDFVGFHNESLARVVADRHNDTVHEAAQWKHANTIAATAFVQQENRAGELEAELARVVVQKNGQIDILESHLGQAQELTLTLEDARKRDNAHALAEIDRLQARLDLTIEQLGYLGRLIEILRDAAAPAATILFNVAQQPGIDERTREIIQQTLAPLDAAIAATKTKGNERE